MREFKGLYLILDRKLAKGRSYEEIIKRTCKFGVTTVQLREKDIETREFVKIAKQLSFFCKKIGVTFLINDRVDVAFVSGADGVHLGQDDMEVKDARKLLGKDKVIGVSAGNEKELEYALKEDVNYIAPGPVFGTTTKGDAGNPIGIDFVKYVLSKTKKPVIPIGGINADNVQLLKNIEIDCFAVISSILKYDNLEEATKKFQMKM